VGRGQLVIRRLLRALPVVLRDLSGLSGVASATIGAWQIYHPAGFITGGLFLIACAWLLARHDGG
jgi:hypothetical protein